MGNRGRDHVSVDGNSLNNHTIRGERGEERVEGLLVAVVRIDSKHL